ncbi:MAG TPA: LPS export ABC transporter periplasmic protein LptC [Bryobacteraceae bacterium]|nr:LPS export ABC transporter periplasmic protein LptC [Bryobacteraceae bacterium]
MRRTRPLLLLAILAVLCAVGVAFYVQKRFQLASTAPTPKSLPPGTSATAEYWSWSHTQEGRSVVEVRAANYRQIREPSRFDLEKVELRIFDKDGKRYDQVSSAHAQFDIEAGVLYSDGQVDITMGVPAEPAPAGRLVFIRTSGVTFESKTGRAFTDRLAEFTFDQGTGKCVGASYNPEFRELHMRSQAEVNWRGRTPGSIPMKIEAGELIYKERDAAVLLSPWSRLTRGGTLLEAGSSIVWLGEEAIRRVEAKDAHGSDRSEDRRIEYAAAVLYMTFAASSQVERIEGEGNAKLSSISATTRTEVSSDRLDLEFDATRSDSVLKRAWAKGRSSVQSTPVSTGSSKPAVTRTLRSDVIELTMAPGGREIASVLTHSPGTVEFVPDQAAQKQRKLDAGQIRIEYAGGNRIRNFHATDVATCTETPAIAGGKKAPPPMLTWSKELTAEFDQQSGRLARLGQSGDFRYEEGERRGRADRAVLEAASNLITLEGSARLWDAAGSTSSDRILLDQASGDMTAVGKVASTRAPESRTGSAGLISSGQPLQARADRMSTTGQNRRIRYEGDAVAWQGGNRIRADVIEIDRTGRVLTANGSVVSQFLDEPSGAESDRKPARSPGFTVVRAKELRYEDETRIAHYRGDVKMTRTATEVKAAELRAQLAAGDSGSRLEKALADGRVEILHSAPGRNRRATGEHAEYYPGEEKILLYGGSPLLVDSQRGSTKGNQLTWFANNDRLLVDGREDQPAMSRILRK